MGSSNTFATQIVVDFFVNQNSRDSVFIGTNSGEILKFSLQPLIEYYQLNIEPDHKSKANYNPYR